MMKRSIANRIAALALALVLAGSLVPGAWAAEGEPEGGGQLTGVTVTPSNLSMKVGERASVRASAAGLSQDQMEDARIEWSLENNDPEPGQDRLWSGQLDRGGGGSQHRRDHGDRPGDPGGHCDLSGRRGEGHLRDHCGSGSAGRPSDHPGGGSGAGAG